MNLKSKAAKDALLADHAVELGKAKHQVKKCIINARVAVRNCAFRSQACVEGSRNPAVDSSVGEGSTNAQGDENQPSAGQSIACDRVGCFF